MAPPHREPWPIPDIPGQLADPSIKPFLMSRVAQLCGLNESRFPGSQPVSFTSKSISQLESENYWAAEKSDGVRVLLFITFNGLKMEQEVFLIDRKQDYRLLSGIHFPHWDNRDEPLTDTILDGELVYDIDPKTSIQSLRYYAFDALVVHGENIMSKPLQKRYGRLKQWVVDPFAAALKAIPEWRDTLPFDLVAKTQELSYHLPTVLNVHIPQLQHGHDGLIFTCAESRYVPGTDVKILKFKPASENSIDFRLELRFPPSRSDESTPDFHMKPAFLLNVWQGGSAYKYFDEMEVSDDEWEEMKTSGEQMDDMIVECYWDTERGAWRMLRWRNDKENANHSSIVDKILVSIDDGVEIEALLARCDSIRSAWKAREAARKEGQQHNTAPVRQSRPNSHPLPPTPGARASVGPVTPGAPAAAYAMTPGLAGLKR